MYTEPEVDEELSNELLLVKIEGNLKKGDYSGFKVEVTPGDHPEYLCLIPAIQCVRRKFEDDLLSV